MYSRLRKYFGTLLLGDEGQGVSEYAIILVLLVLIVVVTVRTMASQAQQVINKVNTALGG
jgi:Flp pilus assembly pilin Flp